MSHGNKNKDSNLIVGLGARRQTPEIKLELDQTTQLCFDDDADAQYAESDTSERSDFEYEMTPGDDIFQ